MRLRPRFRNLRTTMSRLPVQMLLLLFLAASSFSCDLNVWFEREMLDSIFSGMQSYQTPPQPMCEPRGDPEQLQYILPVTTRRYPIVADGHLMSSLYFDSLSRIGVTLAFDVNAYTVHWSAASSDNTSPDRVQYRFLGLKSHNTSVLFHPTLNIPVEGFVPMSDSSFQMNLKCSNQVSGVTSFEVHVMFQWPSNPERQLMVMQHQFKKACLSTNDLSEMQQKCYCRKKCEAIVRSKFRLPHRRAQVGRRAPSEVEEDGEQNPRNKRGRLRRQQQQQRRRARAQIRERRKLLRRRRRQCQKKCRVSCSLIPSKCHLSAG